VGSDAVIAVEGVHGYGNAFWRGIDIIIRKFLNGSADVDLG